MNFKCCWVSCVLIVLGCNLIASTGSEELEKDVESNPDPNSEEIDYTPKEYEVVSLKQGEIRGSLQKSSKGYAFHSFLGIPYGKPPTGSLRFKDPQDADGWEGIRDGNIAPPPCSQIDITSFIKQPKTTYKGEEDCLYLNVYTPEPNFNYAELPVMVYIHGGQFVSGGAADYEPYYILDTPVVLVVIQYRLGVLGFLSTEDSVIPGNFGLKDQTLALKWIHHNIDQFGGSPVKVTLFGSGAGAASVHYQTLTHHTLGLFRRAILQSGTALCPWAQGGVHKETAYFIGKHFECFPEEEEEEEETEDENKGKEDDKNVEGKENENESENEEHESENKPNEDEHEESSLENSEQNDSNNNNENAQTQKKDTHTTENEVPEAEIEKTKEQIKNENLLTCLQNVDTEKLVTSVELFYMWAYLPLLLGPRVDSLYLPESPEYLLKNARHKRVELILGINKDDGSILTNSAFISEGRRMALKHHFPLIGPLSLEFSDYDVAPLNMSIKAYDKYAGGLNVDISDVYNLTKMYTDRHYGVCSDMTAEMHAANNVRYKRNVYFYEFEHRGQLSTADDFGLNFGKEWVTHGDELYYLFPSNKSKEHTQDEDDMKMKELMTKLWYYFAQTGNPTPNNTFDFTWEPYTKENRHHLKLTTTPSMEEDNRKEVREFWASLPTLQNIYLNEDYFKKILNESHAVVTEDEKKEKQNQETEAEEERTDEKDEL